MYLSSKTAESLLNLDSSPHHCRPLICDWAVASWGRRAAGSRDERGLASTWKWRPQADVDKRQVKLFNIC